MRGIVMIKNPPVKRAPRRRLVRGRRPGDRGGQDPPAVRAFVSARGRGRGSTPAGTSRSWQAAAGFTPLLEVSRAAFAAFKAIYECAVR